MPPLLGTMNTWVRFRSRHSFQCLKRRRSATFAWTLLDSARASSALLQSSDVHSGYTSELNAIHLPSGDQTGFAAPVEICVTCFRSSPSGSIRQIWPPVVYAICLPSGDHRGELFDLSPVVICFRFVPSTRTV